MDIRISPRKLCGTFRALPSKSEAHRALILAALSDRATVLTGIGEAGLSDDIRHTLGSIRSLGAAAEVGEDGITVTPPEKYAASAVIDCGESGSTLRFMIPVCAALGGEFRFIRRGRLPERPIKTLTDALAAHGVSFAEDGGDLIVRGRLEPGSFTVAGGESSQYITGILLALTVCGGSLQIAGELESAPYVDITLDMMGRFGAAVFCVERGGETSFSVLRREPGARGDGKAPREIAIGGDWSGAANFIAVCAALGSDDTDAAGADALGLDPDSAQGDRAILDILADTGAAIRTDSAISAKFGSAPRAIDVDMRDTPDLVPLVAVLCAAADGKSTIRGTRRLRLKESDRVASTLALLRSLGVNAEATEDAMFIEGGAIRGGEVDSFGDHRIAMAAAAASCFAEGEVTVRGAECVSKSYPGFWEAFVSLGGKFEALEG